MAIEFKCVCGADCSADESTVGQLHHCEACGLDIPVPAPGAEAPSAQPAAAAEMIAQVLSATAEGGGAPEGGGLEALRGEVAAKQVEGLSQEEAVRRKADREAFRSQLGQKAGADELIAQITGKRPEKPAAAADSAAPAASAEGGAAPSAGAAAPAKGAAATVEMKKALRLTAPPRPIPTGKARAATHIRIKRVVYAPSVVLGFICLALALWCIDALTLNRLPFHRPTVFPKIQTKDPQFVTDEQGKMWALPRGATPSPHADGKMWYLNDFGAEDPAESVEDLQNALAFDRELKEMNLWFGASLLVTALVLLFLGLWTWNDVQIVRRDMGTTELPTAEVAGKTAAAAPAAPPAPSAAPAEGAAPAQEGTPPAEAAAAQGAEPGQGATTPSEPATAAPPPESAASAPPGEATPPPAPEAKPAAEPELPKQV